MYDISDLKKGVKAYVDKKIDSMQKLVLETGVVEYKTTENTYWILIKNVRYKNVKTLNNDVYDIYNTVKVLCNKYGGNYIELIILGKI